MKYLKQFWEWFSSSSGTLTVTILDFFFVIKNIADFHPVRLIFWLVLTLLLFVSYLAKKRAEQEAANINENE